MSIPQETNQVSKRNQSLKGSEVNLPALKSDYQVSDIRCLTMTQPSLSSYLQAWNHPSPLLKNFNPEEAAKYVALCAFALVPKFFNVENTLSKEQCKILGGMVIEEYSWLKASEIKLVFRMASKGRFGYKYKSFSRIDIEVVMLWFQQYYEMREDYFSSMRESTVHEILDPAPELTDEEKEKIHQDWKERQKLIQKIKAKNIKKTTISWRENQKTFREHRELLRKTLIAGMLPELLIPTNND